MKTIEAKWLIWLQLASLFLFLSIEVDGKRPCGRLLRSVKLPAHTIFASKQRRANQAILTCDKGFYFSQGKNTLVLPCASLKVLISSDQAPRCKLGCGNPPSLKNGAVSFTATSVGSVAIYSCHIGFNLMGSRKRKMCRENLRWSGGRSPISCQRQDYSECGVSPFKPFDGRARIVGGKRTEKGKWPWAVKIFVEGKQLCAGTLINKEFVLTVAHCLYRKPKDVRVFFQNKQKTILRSLMLEIHPDYNEVDFRNDIALIRIPKLNLFTRHQQAICLPRKVNTTRIIRNGNNMYVVGWGTTKPKKFGTGNNLPHSKDFKQVKLSFKANKICADHVKNKTALYKSLAWYFNSTTQFCSGDGAAQRDTCTGDNGGPAMVLQQHPVSGKWRWFQVGIVSWGSGGCAQVGEFSYYTKVSAFVDWIDKIITKS